MLLPDKKSVIELFRETKDISIDDFETRISQLHHQYIRYKLCDDFSAVEDVFKLEEEAEYLIGICTHPYRIDKYPNQLLRDGLSISATIFEFLGDIAIKYEDSLDEPQIYYLRSALCYGLCGFESRTSILSKRILAIFSKPECNLNRRNLTQYTYWFISLYLSQGNSLIYNKLFYHKYNREFNAFLEESGIDLSDVEILGNSAIYIHLSIGCLNASRGLVQGETELLDSSYRAFSAAKKIATHFGAFQLYFIADSLHN